MTESQNDEVRRILAMVEEGKVTPEEAERLIGSMEQRKNQVRCPFCAEAIPMGSSVCPECNTPLAPTADATPSEIGRSGGFHALTGLGKFLVIYTFAVCSIVILASVPFGFSPAWVAQGLLSVFGFVAAVLICKGNPIGWVMGIWWAGLQMIPVTISGMTLNKQFFHFGINFVVNGSGLGINLVGIVLLILFIKARQTTVRKV
jgi:hypothetical protein